MIQIWAKDRTIDHPQGKVLGGSSAINNMAFIPSSKAVLDAWGALGNKGWDWTSMKPYYKKFHTLILPDELNIEHLGLK